jgi:hypothetical protein
MKSITICLYMMMSVSVAAQSPEEVIRSIMDNQVQAWNKGDIDGFMKGYWESDSLVFIGSKGLTYGYQKTLSNYKTTYATPELMGTLSFEYKAFRPLGDTNMLVIGGWKINRASGEILQGHFSLTWEMKDGEWVIIADHSS